MAHSYKKIRILREQEEAERLIVIDPFKLYSLREIVALKLIPTVRTLDQIYYLVSNKYRHPTKKTKSVRLLSGHTTKTKIACINQCAPWKLNAVEILVRGTEIIKFLEQYNLIKE